MLERLRDESRTLIFYEAVHRIAAALHDMCDAFGNDRQAFIGRELTKLHEQCVRGSLRSLSNKVDDKTIVGKGEFVIVVGGADESAETSLDVDRLLAELSALLPAKDAAKASAAITGLKKNALYQRILELKDGKGRT